MRKFTLSITLLFIFTGIQKTFAQVRPINVFKTYRVAIVAPLYLDSVFEGYHLKSETSIPNYSLAGIDFVQGAEMALDTINLGNKHVEAFIFDSKSVNQPLPALLKSGKMDNMDLIIGSVKNPDYYQLSQFAFQKNIPFVSATYPNDGGITNDSDLIIANSTLKAHCEAIFSYILQKHGSDHIYLFHKKNDNRIDNYFKEINFVDGKPLLNIKDIMLDSSVSASGLRYLIDTTKPVVIIGASLNQAFSQKLADACYPISKNNSITLIGMPNWDGFSCWYKNTYMGFPIRYTTPHFIEKDNIFKKYLDDKYYSVYNIYPSDMVEKGFGITYYFTNLLINHPGNLMQNLNDTSYAPFHYFTFRPVHIQGNTQIDYYENKHLFIMQILNGEIEREL
ncbi:MAG TPA: hypothetical protein VFT78_13470 [Hanamia sp.]|nr:hypothetical protein [Hanamia sp.]